MGRDNNREVDTKAAVDSRVDHENSRWRSPIIRDENDDAVGAVLFLTDEDLSELGVNPESAEEILYSIDEGEVIRVIENDSPKII